MGSERRTRAPVHQLGSRRADVCARTCRRGYAQGVLDNAISLIDADGELADVLSPEEVERAKRGALARISRLSPGVWDAAAALERDSHHRGFLVVDGLLSREVDVLGRRCVELIGPCDVLRPWTWDEEGSHVQAEVGWMVLEETRMAVLDHGLVERIMPWPALGVELFNSGTRRAHHLAVALAISHHQRVDDRLLLTLWHLAERWGKVTPAGIVVPLPLGHQRLADLVGAHRPSVTSALGELTRGGAISRRDDGVWVLHGPPQEELRHHKLAQLPT
jgi:CRP/FNR family transcriptional regulator, cyclic AMP receptor protein